MDYFEDLTNRTPAADPSDTDAAAENRDLTPEEKRIRQLEDLIKLNEFARDDMVAEIKKKKTIIGILVAAALILAVWVCVLALKPQPKAPKYGELSTLVGDDAQLDKFAEAYKTLKDEFYFEHDDAKLMEGAVGGLASGLDDIYTYYYTPEEFNQFNNDLSGSYVGIGVSVTMDADEKLTILRVFPDSPAEAAGMQRGDKVIAVGDTDVTGGMDSGEIVAMIRGEEGTTVKITFFRPSTGESFEKDVERRKISNYDVTYDILEGDIGYIQIGSFDAIVDQQFKHSMDTMLSKGAKGIIIDLRDNGGGYLTQTLNMCDMLVDKDALLLTLKHANGKEESYNSWSDPTYVNIPVVVLVNEYSASASEVFTGILKDYGLATVVGVKTFGKGIVQSMMTFDDGSAMKFTTSSYFTPGGYEIHGNGIEPDVEIEQDGEYESYSISVIPEGKDVQLNKALEVIRGKINGN